MVLSQKHTNTHISPKVHVRQIQELVFQEKKPLRERPRPLKACILQKEGLHVFHKGACLKNPGTPFSVRKKALRERPRPLKACTIQWRILISHKENLDLARGESWSYTRRINSISRENEKVGFPQGNEFWRTRGPRFYLSRNSSMNQDAKRHPGLSSTDISSEFWAGSHGSSQITWGHCFWQVWAGCIKSHSKTPLIQLCTFHKGACPKFEGQIRLGDSSPMHRTAGASGGV